MGKTTTFIKLLLYQWIKQFDKIFIFCPSFQEDDVWSVIDPYVGKNKKIQVYAYFDIKKIKEKNIWAKAQKRKNKKHQTLIYIDDCTGQPGFKVDQPTGYLNIMAATANHNNVSIILCVQKITMASTILRCNMEAFMTFTLNEKETKPTWEEFGMPVPFKLFRELIHDATAKPYSHYYMNRQGPGTPDYYHNFIPIDWKQAQEDSKKKKKG